LPGAREVKEERKLYLMTSAGRRYADVRHPGVLPEAGRGCEPRDYGDFVFNPVDRWRGRRDLRFEQEGRVVERLGNLRARLAGLLQDSSFRNGPFDPTTFA
jgi:hypothetical protein